MAVQVAGADHHGGTVRLTVTHEDLPADQYEGTAQGWAKVLSSLKSLLETGQPRPISVLCS
ncbi:SRPBCC domain-containing protein [Sphaerisporangium perillae]|uniref:SRPBCC domain-containing protein n=1 Tax=Sphaerisporangium perillae TaxID=2935860 RepID=UPI00201026BF|nr:SRPBCC domain-containing protein [Sphaerisporangium perillae]